MVPNMNLLQTISDCGCGATVRIVPTTIANIKTKTCDFDLPPELEASEPPEARGLARDEVRLMVSSSPDNRVMHTQFREIGAFLEPGGKLTEGWTDFAPKGGNLH